MKRFVFLVMMVAAVMFSLSIALQGYHKRGAERKSETLHQMEICKTRTGNVAL